MAKKQTTMMLEEKSVEYKLFDVAVIKVVKSKMAGGRSTGAVSINYELRTRPQGEPCDVFGWDLVETGSFRPLICRRASEIQQCIAESEADAYKAVD